MSQRPAPSSLPAPPTIEQAVAALRRGEVIGLPTETVYGLAADAQNVSAVEQIFAIKGRPAGHPLILHLAEAAWMSEFCRHVPSGAERLAGAFWPGPLTLVLVRNPALVPDVVTGGLETVAVRVPAHPVARAVLGQLGRPIAAPSANRFGGVSPTRRAHVLADLGASVKMVLEGGESKEGVESTIVDLTRDAPRLLRPGTVTQAELEAVWGAPFAANDEEGPVVPGSLASHYAPKALVQLVEGSRLCQSVADALSAGRSVGVVCIKAPTQRLPETVHLLQVGPTIERAAHELYAALRELDARGCEIIVTSLPPPEGIGLAVRDRLIRAAAAKPT